MTIVRLMAEGRSAEETRLALEKRNVGRLRIAAKGIDRNNVAEVGKPGLDRLVRLAGTTCGEDVKSIAGLTAERIAEVTQPPGRRVHGDGRAAPGTGNRAAGPPGAARLPNLSALA